MVPMHSLWTPHNVTLVLGLAAKHRPLPALLDYAVTVNPQRRAMLGAAARRISRWFRAQSFLSKCDAIFDAFEKCVSSWGSISALPSRELCEQRHLVVFKRRDRHRTLPPSAQLNRHGAFRRHEPDRPEQVGDRRHRRTSVGDRGRRRRSVVEHARTPLPPRSRRPNLNSTRRPLGRVTAPPAPMRHFVW